MFFSSGWLKRLIWTLCENPPLCVRVPAANHNTVKSPPSKWDQLSPVSLTRLWEVVRKAQTRLSHSLTLRCQKDFKVAVGPLSLCQVPRINCSLHHSCFCLFTLCSRHSHSVTSPYYLYVHFSASIFIIIAFRMFVLRLEERQCFHC